MKTQAYLSQAETIDKRRNKPMRIKTLLVFVLMLVLIFQFPQIIKAEEMTSAKIEGIKGEVFVKRGAGQREFKAFEKMQVSQGDWVRTGAKSSATIVYDDGNQTIIDANTKIIIQRLTRTENGKQTSVKLFTGVVWNKIKKMLNIEDRYEVETPTMVMGVRGTLYLVSVDQNGNVGVDVVEGAVAAGDNADAASGGTSFLLGTGNSLNTAHQSGGRAPIDISTLVQSVSPLVLVHIVSDILERAQDIENEARQLLGQSQDQQVALQALQMAIQVSELASLVQQVIQAVQQSVDTQLNQEFQQTLQNNNQTMQTLVQNIQQQNQSAQNLNQQAQQNAQEQGLTQEVIEQTVNNIVNASVGGLGANPSGLDMNSIYPVTDRILDSSSGTSSNSVTGNALAVITSPTDTIYVSSLARITGTAQDIDNGPISAVQIQIKKTGTDEFLQSDGNWAQGEYWFNTSTNNAYATWTYDLTSQQRTGVESLGLVQITLNVRVNDGAINTLNSIASFTVDTIEPTSKSGTAGCRTSQDGINGAVYDAGDKIQITFEEPIKVSTFFTSANDLSNLNLSTGASWGSSPTIQALAPVSEFTDSFEITLGSSPIIASNGSQNIFIRIGAAEDRAGNKNTAPLRFDIPTLPVGPIAGNATGTVSYPVNNSWLNGISMIEGTANDIYSDPINTVNVAIKKGSATEYLQGNGSWSSAIHWFNASSLDGFANWSYILDSNQKTGIIVSGENQLHISLKVDDGEPNILSNHTTVNLDVTAPLTSSTHINQAGGTVNTAYDSGDIISLTFSEPIRVSTLFANPTDISKIFLTGEGTLDGSQITAVDEIDGFSDSVNITLGSTVVIAADGSQDIIIAIGAAEDKAGNTNESELIFNLPSLVSEFAFNLQINEVSNNTKQVSGITMPNAYVRIKKVSGEGPYWGSVVQAAADGSFIITDSSSLQSGEVIGVYVGYTDTFSSTEEIGRYFLAVGLFEGGGITVNQAYATTGTVTGFATPTAFVQVSKGSSGSMGSTVAASDSSFEVNYTPLQTAGTELRILVLDISDITLGMCKIVLQ